MKTFAFFSAAVLVAASLAACADTRTERAAIPSPNDQSAYVPMALPKPLPPPGYEPTEYPPGYQPPAVQPMGGQPPVGQPGQPGAMAPIPTLPNEPAFVHFYEQHRNPKIMIFVNRTIQGDPVSNDALQQLIRNPDGSVNAVPGQDVVGATPQDYQMIELSLVRFFDNTGHVTVSDSQAARAKLNREQVLRIENADPAAARLLATELQQDILIRISATPTRQATSGQPSVRILATAVGTTDARILGTSWVDMPLPIGKTSVNQYTGYIANELMGDMAQKWSQPAALNPIEVRVYKVASVDDGIKIGNWLKATQGVASMNITNATGGATTAYATFAVGYDGAPADLYGNLKEAIGLSQGIKAVDLTNNTINLELTGQMLQLTTTRRSETKTTVETTTTEDKKIEPINPATPVQAVPPQAPQPPQ